MLFSDPGFFSIHYIGQWQCPPYIMSSIHALRQALMRSTVAQDYMYLRVHWEVNEWSDRLIDLRCVNGSSPGEKVSYALSFTTPGFFLHLYICVFCETTMPSSHNSLKSHRLIKVIDWLLGAFCFFHHSIYLFWSVFECAPAYGNTSSLFSVEKFIRHMSPCAAVGGKCSDRPTGSFFLFRASVRDGSVG